MGSAASRSSVILVQIWVITDMLMPEQEGILTIRQIRSECRATKIIAISGGLRLRDLDVLGMARKFGADDAFAKPFDPGKLLCRIQKLLKPSVRRPVRSMLSDETGTTAIEYALIALLIGLVLISLQNSIGASVVGFFMSVATGL